MSDKNYDFGQTIEVDAEHGHQYTIPVEYHFITRPAQTELEYMEVTKLRCPCGEEIER